MANRQSRLPQRTHISLSRSSKRLCVRKVLGLDILSDDMFHILLSPFCSVADLFSLGECSVEMSTLCLKAIIPRIRLNVKLILDWDPEWLCEVKTISLVASDFMYINMLPNVEWLTIDYEYQPDRVPMNSFHSTLDRLTLVNAPNPYVYTGFLPQTLRCLDLEIKRDQRLLPMMLPSCLEELRFSGLFDQELVSGMFPGSLKILDLGPHFNQRISCNVLPSKLQELWLTGRFNKQLVIGSLPRSLKGLILLADYEFQIMPGILPQNLERLRLGFACHELVPNSLPDSLTLLYWYGGGNDAVLRPNVLPPNLKKLCMRAATPIQEGVLPSSLEQVWIFAGQGFVLLPNIFPHGVRTLYVGGHFNQEHLCCANFPTSLEYLKFGPRYNQEVTSGAFPDNLKRLWFGNEFNRDISVGVLPAQLEELKFGDGSAKFNKPFDRHVLPQTVRVLDVGNAFRFPLTRGILPSCMRQLYVSSDHPDKRSMTSNLLNAPQVDIIFH